MTFEYPLDNELTLKYKYLHTETILAIESFAVDLIEFHDIYKNAKNSMLLNGYDENEINTSSNVEFHAIRSNFLSINFICKIQNFHHTEIVKLYNDFPYTSIYYPRKLNEYGSKVQKLVIDDIRKFENPQIEPKNSLFDKIKH